MNLPHPYIKSTTTLSHIKTFYHTTVCGTVHGSPIQLTSSWKLVGTEAAMFKEHPSKAQKSFSGVFYDGHKTSFIASRNIKFHVAAPLLSLQAEMKH